MFQVIEHRDEVAQAAAQPVQLPHNERVAVLYGFQATRQGRTLRGCSRNAFVFEDRLAPGALQGGPLHGGVLIVSRDAGIAVFHACILEQQNGTSQALFLLVEGLIVKQWNGA